MTARVHPWILAAAGAAALATGCVSVDRDAARAVDALRRGDSAPALAWSGELARDSLYSKTLGTVELARVNMLAGNDAAAADAYRAAVDTAVDRRESAPVIRLGDVGNTVLASTVTDDRTRQYQLAPYELNLALEHGIVTQAAAGRREDALVDCRLAVYVQDNLAETYGADAVKAQTSTNSLAQSLYDSNAAALNELIAATRNSWENPVLWWLTGVLFEADGEFDSAQQSYRKAAAIRPDCPVFAADAARAARTPAAGRAKLAVIVGDGFVSRRQSLKVPIPIYTGMSFDMPMYRDAAYVPRQVALTVGGRAAGVAAPALNIQSLASRDLKEHMPGVIARNLTRAAVQAGAQAAVNAAGNDYAKLAVFVGNAVVSALRAADLRSWVTLPQGEQVYVAHDLAPGVYDVRATAGPFFTAQTVVLKSGETKVIYLNLME